MNENQHMLAIYIPDGIESIRPYLDISLNNPYDADFYIKNCGLYKVNEGILPEPEINADVIIQYSTDPTIISKIVLPAVFCFKEQYDDGSPVGCMDQ